jgi:hypothetical protein
LPGGNGDPGTELYTLTSTFALTGQMIAGRHSHTATLLPDGTVLVAGGYTFWPSSIAGAELYHPLALVPAPVLFSLSGDGRGQGAIWHADTGQIASGDNPAVAGQVLAMYTTSLSEGALIPPQVAIGGQMAEVWYFGNAPGYPRVNQINLRVPSGIVPGSAVSVRLNYLARPSNDVTIAVQ